MDDPAKLEQMIDMIATRLEEAKDPEERGQMEKILDIARERLSRLKSASER